MSRRRDPAWRDRASADLLVGLLPTMDFSGPVLVMEDTLPDLEDALAATGREVTTWNRRALGGRLATPWPPPGPFRTVALRLPRSKYEFLMTLHAAVSTLEPGGVALLYGANDEGIQSALGHLRGLFPDAETVAVGGRCRVLRGVRRGDMPGLKDSLAKWKSAGSLDYPGLTDDWVSYPGIFAHGGLDHGTRLLLDALPSFPAGSRILDYGCGSGIVAAVAGGKGEDLVVEMLDVDAVALEAARENVPGGRRYLRDGLPPAGSKAFDFILSNPPFHRGKAEEPGLIRSLIQGAPALLGPKGVLVFVAQKRLSLEPSLRGHFREVSMLAENPTFRVWRGRGPRNGAG